MKEVNAHPEWLSDLSKSALNSVTTNNRRLVDGSDTTLVNPAYEDLNDVEIQERIEGILLKLDLTDTLRKIEDSNFSKFGPRSIAKKWVERKDDLLAYFKHEDYNPEWPSESGTLRPISLHSATEGLLKSSSASLPYMMRKGAVLEDAERHYEDQRERYPCILYTRTQEGGKTRNVWGFAISDTITEQRFIVPYLGHERTLSFRSALDGPDAVDTAISGLLANKSDDEVMVSVDFSAYDASISPQHSSDAFSVIAAAFQPQYAEEIMGICRRFVTIPVFTPDGEWSGPHGVPSGSAFTNTIDSIVQWSVNNGKYACQIQGDDGIYRVPRSELDLFHKSFEEAGLVLNDDKSEIFEGQEGIFLQRYYNPIYRSIDQDGLGGVYSLYRAFNRIKYLERWTDLDKIGMEGSDFFSLRTIMILENCKHHPGFVEAVTLAHSLDKKGLHYSKQSVSAFSRAMAAKSRAKVVNIEKGIDSFETVKVLRLL